MQPFVCPGLPVCFLEGPKQSTGLLECQGSSEMHWNEVKKNVLEIYGSVVSFTFPAAAASDSTTAALLLFKW